MDLAKIKKLREKTGASISECRQALSESDNDLVKAEKWLTERGIEKAAKKAERETSQGLIEAYVHAGRIGVLVEISCETDFVARTDDFKKLVHEVALQISAMNPKDIDTLLKQEYIRDASMTIESLIKTTIAKLGENITVKRFTRFALGE